MSTGSNIVTALNATTVSNGLIQVVTISFGSSAVQQAAANLYLEVDLLDPTNTGAPATFEIQIQGGIGSVNTALGTPFTAPGIYTVTAPSPITNWQACLTALSGGVSPTVIVRGVAGE